MAASRLLGVLLPGLLITVAGCGSASHSTGAAGSPSGITPTISTGLTTASTSPASPTSSPTISVPAYLCEGTDQAQNAADAYMGALGAGNDRQAEACVQPGTVPASVTRGLLVHQSGTAAYLPRTGVDGPTVFGYQGEGKSIDVTVSKVADGSYRVTRVAVRGG